MGVDGLRLTVLADDYAGYEVRGLYAQHGLSILLEIRLGNAVKRILFDCGQDGSAIIRNAELLGLGNVLKSIDMIVLSHSHYDHTGGLLDILSYVRRPILVVAHPDIVKPAIYVDPQGVRDVGLPYPLTRVEEMGAKLLLLREASHLGSGTVFLGEVPRYRKDLVSSIENLYTVENGRLVPHPLNDDTGLAIDVEGYGVVLVAGCSHSGIVNMVIHTKKVLGKPVKCVVGGLHLVGADRETVQRVIDALRSEGVEEVYVGHCTGLRAEYMLLESYGERFGKIYVGFSRSWGSI